MADSLLATIIIDNYNYDQFLAEAINSALDQSYTNTEVIIVDDGSTDSSRQIVLEYGDRVIPVFKSNGGQASAFNAGFNKSTGDVIFFLDSDDILFPDAVENVVKLFDTNISKVQWPLWVVDEFGNRTGEMRPSQLPPDGDFRDIVLKGGPTSCTSSPTSGNAWSRTFLEKVFPMPEEVSYYRTCADEYLYTLAPVFGKVKTVREPQGFYRIHGNNIYSALSFREKLKLELDGHTQQTAALSSFLEKQGFEIDVAVWRKNSWFHRLEKSMADIEAHIPVTDPFILVDEGTWNIKEIYPNRNVLPFLERNGEYWGPPENDEVAISELNRMRDDGACFIVFGWPGFWWLNEYPNLEHCLQTNFNCVLRNERMVVYNLKKPQDEKAVS